MMKTFTRGSLTFDVLDFGQRKTTTPTIVLLHGFPASAASWTATAQHLAAEGYRVLVPEQRGYAVKARPPRRRDYALYELAADVIALLDAAGVEQAHIVGHDWGGAVAWHIAGAYPERTASLTVVSAPHPKALLRSLATSRQLFLSWYMLYFQLPFLPEYLLLRKQGNTLQKALRKSGLSAETAARYAHSMQDKKRLQGALNWYRALPFNLSKQNQTGKITVPTLFVYGYRDTFLSVSAACRTRHYVTGRYQYLDLPDQTHWIPEQSPRLLAHAIAAFIRHEDFKS